MRRFFALVALCAAPLLTSPAFAGAPLAQLTPTTGSPVLFDAKRITAVVALPTSEFRVDAEALRLSPQIFFPLPAELASNGPKTPVTQVLGIFANLMPVRESVDDVLKLAGRDQFVQLTLLSGDKVWMRASAIGWVSHDFPAGTNPGVGSYLGLGLAPGRPTAVKEDVDAVRRAIEQVLPN